jgi:hypothetical protein
MGSDQRFQDSLAEYLPTKGPAWPSVSRPTADGRQQSDQDGSVRASGHADVSRKIKAIFDRYNIVTEGDLWEAARKLSGTASLMGTIVSHVAQLGV